MYEIPCLENEAVLEDFGDGLVFKQLRVDDPERIEEFARFVFDIYREEFARRFDWRATEEDRRALVEEELSFCHRGVYLIVEHEATQQIMATIRGVVWAPDVHFDFEHVTGVTIADLSRKYGVLPGQIMEVSQIAAAETILQRLGYPRGRSRGLMKALFAHLYESVLLNDVQLIVGETDPLIERLYAQLGSKMTPESGYFTQPPAFIGEARLSSVLVEAITKSPLLPRVPARQARAV